MTKDEMRDRLIEVLQEANAETAAKVERGEIEDAKIGWEFIVDCLIANGVTFADESRWIPVSEHKPKHDDIVLAFFPEMRGTDGEIQIQKGWSIKPKFCSHWMPLPEPPKEIDYGYL